MEVGAVKHALNNEIILLKKKLNQARTQTINKLTRKIKILKTRKGPDKEKFARKAENFLSEVTLLKKVKPKELVRFAITYDGNLLSYINKPNVSEERAMARLLQHKSLVDKTKMLKDTFGSMPADQILLTRKERLQLKKEQKLKLQENTKKTTLIIGAGKFDEEPVSENITFERDSDTEGGISSNEDNSEIFESEVEDETQHTEQPESKNSDSSEIDEDSYTNSLSNDNSLDENQSSEENGAFPDTDERPKSWRPGQFVLRNPNSENDVNESENKEDIKEDHKRNEKPTDKSLSKPNVNKPKQTKKKTIKEKKKKVKIINIREDEMKPEATIVDSFFLTSTGENYRTLAEPRMPDVVKDDNTHDNRRMRRAAMFGRPIKPAFNNNKKLDERESFKGQQYKKEFRGRPLKPNDRFGQKDSPAKYSNTSFHKTNMPERNVVLDKRKADVKEEKLHPSWEAKKQKSGIVAFQGKKVIFNNDD